MSQLLQSSKIIGDLVDGVDATGVQLAVKFQDLVQEGATIPPDKASSRPEVTFSGADPCALYTLITSDPDPPSPTNPIYKEWLHCVLQLMHIA